MHTMKRWLRCALWGAGILMLLGPLATGEQAGRFDKLVEADRKVFGERFEKEIWPLLQRGGKDGCVGCHSSTKQGSLRLTGDAAKDFRRMLGDGFFLKGDAGSLLERIRDQDPKRRMPPGNRPAWNAAEIKLLQAFVEDLDLKNR